tara:strand:+ start:276 stop:413 length:138 start_codon:yes stop_codon:yes gene_type:complete
MKKVPPIKRTPLAEALIELLRKDGVSEKLIKEKFIFEDEEEKEKK